VEPVSLVVGALAAGGLAGLSDAAKSAVGELYGRIRSWFGRDRQAQQALDELEVDPSSVEPVTAILAGRDLAAQSELLELAARVMELVDPAGSAAGKYVVDASNAKGVQIGDHNTQSNTFNS